ncbi:MAG: AMMECR1 domain-containing protein, partial [Eubacteriales bacterium]|nr:AMMECR1 domain-containing protein [Eubacteriales bacterium]
MSILGAIIVPHPPLIIPAVGHGRERDIQPTIDAYRIAAKQVADWNPDVLFLASPHTVMYADYFHISPGRNVWGDMSSFGAPKVSITTEYDEDLRKEMIRRAENIGLRAGTLGERDPALDHGAFIPLYFLHEAGVNCPIVRFGLSGHSALDHYRLGQCAAQAAEALGKRAVFIASGDLSHKLKPDGPYGFAAEGPIFDQKVTDVMVSGNFLEFLSMDEVLCDKAAECGLGSFRIMAGALDGLAVESRLLSYEGPFGVGYAVAVFEAKGPDKTRCFVEVFEREELEQLSRAKAAEDPWVQLARLSLETYVRTGKELAKLPEGLPEEMTSEAAGVFVSLHKYHQLRGCIGTIAPTTSCVAEEIVRNAISAGTEDPRFHP